ncbi:MAG: DUF5020 family protein [Bacteroidales bacterium]|nr:DUF5020 family protein [Bacteroidales bacterium]
MKKYLLSVVIIMMFFGASAQNLQLHYDFGRYLYDDLKKIDENNPGRFPLTSTYEFFKADRIGSTFFFADFDYSSKSVYGAYWEIYREFCFWPDSKMNWLSFHIEYNGGLNRMAGGYHDAWLTGLTYSGHSQDYTKTWSLSVLYKLIPNTIACHDPSITDNLKKDIHNFQITGVWGVDFAHGWCRFNGFADFWREARAWQYSARHPQGTQYIFISEPQFWVNLDKIPGWENFHFSVGSEVEISNNFIAEGFYCIPTIGIKWDLSK